MSQSASNEKKNLPIKLISTNSSARSTYAWLEIVEAGISLTGTEIKSIRSHAPQLKEAFVEITSKPEAWLVHCHVAPYSHGNIWNHEPERKRKLLLHSHQLKKMYGQVTQKGVTIIPTRMYFKGGRVKVELALAKGKKTEDRREDVKARTAEREMAQALKQRNRRSG